MVIIFNILVIGLVGLIAYWWANEGLFSALLHLVCVIAAGTIAIAVWEPITMSLLKGGGFDNYAWGVVLIGVFSFSLYILRFASDKLVPSNIQFPDWVNLSFGGLTGACAGVLTIGICLIGAGFVQSTNEIMEFRGTGRDENNRGIIGLVGEPIWLDVPKYTSDFFSLLSVGSFHPDISGAPLQQYNPNLHELSTLVRDTYDNGKGQLSLAPNAANATKVAVSDDGLIVVQVTFKTLAKDFGGQLILASSQIRLISDATGKKKPDILYPISWKQEVKDGGEWLFRYDDISHYATSVPGRPDTGIKFAFDTKGKQFTPKFIQIRGTRLDLPTGDSIPLDPLAADVYRGHQLSNEEVLAHRDGLGKKIQHLIEVSHKIRGLRISANGVPSGIELDEDNYFVRGKLSTVWHGQKVSSALAIKGIRASEGTVIVQVDVSQNKDAEFQDLLPVISQNSPVVLIDANGRRYPPIGYIIGNTKRMELTLTPSSPILSMGELPMHRLRSSTPPSMILVFQVTSGVRLKELRVGEHTIGTCDIEATSRFR